eukprot:CCRYP_002239-RA/>CCRYP_002239-RA protein AED:0.33 eAED:0.32 QI:0/-1/0/1/-1/1/1/0/513
MVNLCALYGQKRTNPTAHVLLWAATTPTADMLAAKILFNSVISTAAARFMTMDISNFYLNTPLQRPKNIKMKITDIPEEIINKYKLRNLMEPDNCIYIIIVLGMYGLPHAGLIANALLKQRLNKHGYHQSKLVPGLWKLDDFRVKYVGKEHALHLKSVLESYYPLSTDWTSNRYISIRLDWGYHNHKVHLSMPGYKAKALKQFQHKTPSEPQHSPFSTKPIKYGTKKQYATPPSTAPLLDKKGKKFIQQVCGKLLFLGRAVDSPLLCPISAIASQLAAPTLDMMTQTLHFLDYLATQEEAVLTYHASDMILAAHSDASYLSKPQARSRAGGHFFLSSDADIPPNNGAILNIAHIIKHVMVSATEAELAALFITAREAVYIRIILMELGHKQPATPLQTDHAMAEAVTNGNVQPKRQSHGHALPPAMQSQMTRTISHLLAPWPQQLCRLLDEASLLQTSPAQPPRIHHAAGCTRDATPRLPTQTTRCSRSIVFPSFSIYLSIFELPQGCDDTIL